MATFQQKIQVTKKQPNLYKEIKEIKKVIQTLRIHIENLENQFMKNEQKNNEEETKKLDKKTMPPIFELPDEVLLQILGYLSNFDILVKVPQVCKKFHRLCQDELLITNIEINVWWNITKKELWKQLLEVCKRSIKLTSFSIDLGIDTNKDPQFQNVFFREIAVFRHRFLEEFSMRAGIEVWGSDFFWHFRIRTLWRYLSLCPKLKILKLEFKPIMRFLDNEYSDDHDAEVTYPLLSSLFKESISYKLKNLTELHLLGFEMDMSTSDFKIFLDVVTKKFPRLKMLCLSLEMNTQMFEIRNFEDEHDVICRKYANQRQIYLKVVHAPTMCVFESPHHIHVQCIHCGKPKTCDSKDFKMYAPVK